MRRRSLSTSHIRQPSTQESDGADQDAPLPVARQRKITFDLGSVVSATTDQPKRKRRKSDAGLALRVDTPNPIELQPTEPPGESVIVAGPSTNTVKRRNTKKTSKPYISPAVVPDESPSDEENVTSAGHKTNEDVVDTTEKPNAANTEKSGSSSSSKSNVSPDLLGNTLSKSTGASTKLFRE
jgi:hypothetical protein